MSLLNGAGSLTVGADASVVNDSDSCAGGGVIGGVNGRGARGGQEKMQKQIDIDVDVPTKMQSQAQKQRKPEDMHMQIFELITRGDGEEMEKEEEVKKRRLAVDLAHAGNVKRNEDIMYHWQHHNMVSLHDR